MNAPNPSHGTYYLNGASRPRKSLKSNKSKRRKKAKLGEAKRLASWSGYDGSRGCVVFMFERTLSRAACSHLGLRYPALQPGIYCAAETPAADQFHPDIRIAGDFIDRRAA
ncbi:hypothetical protein [Nitratireductor sp. GZWM139]|uniref:hypothetical protein n=1 Tax=Nitratireductor sp. GZWM139 TaxID=2950541 RepID=UPI0024BEF448|nr:hypothetical protein [Nitratireductor sp. GZWM139]MDJ1464946.1 hypothetical protein [Nitratireductor sp. GZWM139]